MTPPRLPLPADLQAMPKAELLNLAFAWTKQGRGAVAQALYDDVAAVRPVHPLRALWPLAATTSDGRAGEEWATAALKRADLHISYAQVQAAAEILAGITNPALQSAIAAGLARIALTAGGDPLDHAARARVLAPGSSYAAVVHGAVLVAAGRVQEAVAPLTQAAGERAGAYALLGYAWHRLENYSEAVAAYRKALAFDSVDPLAANNLMPMLLGARQYADAVTHADDLLARHLRDTSALAFKCVALSELNRTRELDALTDPAALVRTEKLAVPPGYADIAAFNRALAEEIARDPTLGYERNTTKFGHQTLDLAQTRAPAIQALNRVLTAAARHRADTVRRPSDHPFDRAAPKDFQIYSWAVVMKDEGHQAPHFHPNGWLSGVYYIDVPGAIREADPERHGWLEFGRSEDPWHQAPADVLTSQVRPEAGMLITFPSYFWHSTRPLKSREPRISFAFDIIPV